MNIQIVICNEEKQFTLLSLTLTCYHFITPTLFHWIKCVITNKTQEGILMDKSIRKNLRQRTWLKKIDLRRF